MDFSDFLKHMEKNGFHVEKTEEGRYLASRRNKTVEVEPHKDCSYEKFLSFFESAPSNVGHNDLEPSGPGIGGNIGGSRVGKDDPLFSDRKVAKEKDLRFPRFAKFDPMVPSKDKKKGFDPTPDHLKKPGNGDGSFF